MKRTYYVYEHWRVDSCQCFYVGKGHGRRAWDLALKGTRAESWIEVMKTLNDEGVGVDVVIIADGLTEGEALDLEHERIMLHGRLDIGTGTLVNRTNGYSGTTGMQHTDESRAKIARGREGFVFTPAHRAKISAAGKGRIKSVEHRQRIGDAQRGRKKGPVSPETRAKISASSKGKPKSEAFKEMVRQYWIRWRIENGKPPK